MLRLQNEIVSIQAGASPTHATAFCLFSHGNLKFVFLFSSLCENGTTTVSIRWEWISYLGNRTGISILLYVFSIPIRIRVLWTHQICSEVASRATIGPITLPTIIIIGWMAAWVTAKFKAIRANICGRTTVKWSWETIGIRVTATLPPVAIPIGHRGFPVTHQGLPATVGYKSSHSKKPILAEAAVRITHPVKNRSTSNWRNANIVAICAIVANGWATFVAWMTTKATPKPKTTVSKANWWKKKQSDVVGLSQPRI